MYVKHLKTFENILLGTVNKIDNTYVKTLYQKCKRECVCVRERKRERE